MQENSVLTSQQPLEQNSASEAKERKMEWHIYPHEDRSGDWVVQGIDINGEGEIFTTIFTDADAEARAREYYEWQVVAQQKAA
jgi:hypothetical protein